MRRGSFVRATLVLAMVAGALVVPTGPASAHGSGVILVPRQLSGRPDLRLDGSCEPDYPRSGNGRTLLYRPDFEAPPATFALITTADALWVCVRSLARRPDAATTHPSMTLVFDPRHDGGAAPDVDDVAFALGENGSTTEFRGDGTRFVPQTSPGGWAAQTDPTQDVVWTAEFRISRWRIGYADPNTVIGFQARHTSLRSGNDSFPWPANSRDLQPRTWGDLFFLGAPSTTLGDLRLDAGRVTQGLEWDIAQGANAPYDFVAGKDAMVQGRLYTLGSIAGLTYSACRVQRISPSLDPAQLFGVDSSLSPTVSPVPIGQLGTMGDLRCWIPGSAIQTPGVYRFSLVAQMAGGERQVVDVGDRVALRARAVRMLIYRWVFPATHREYRPWDAVLDGSAIDSMRDLQRVLPVPAGVGGVSLDVTPPSTAPGLRYLFAPTVYQCVRNDDETMDQAVGRCDATTRNNADLVRMAYDMQAAARDEASLGHRDRFDLQEVLVSTPRSGGGQSCHANSASAGVGLDSRPSGASHYIVIQETEHCWFQVQPDSPHIDPDQDLHSINTFFWPGRTMVNVQTREEIVQPRGPLFWLFDNSDGTQDRHERFINEGVEFDRLRTVLQTLPPPSGNAPPPGAGRMRGKGSTQLQLAFLMDHTTAPDTITVQTSRRLDDSTLAPTEPDPTSPFSLVFRDDAEAVVGTLPFGVTEVASHDGKLDVEGEVLVAEVPDGTAKVAIEEDGAPQPLFEEEFTAEAPTVTNVDAKPNGSHTLDVSWSSGDVDSTGLTFSVYFQQQPDALRTLVATGLTETAYAFDTSFAPGTTDGVITVEASDGWNTTEGSTSPVTVADKQPDVAVASPHAGETLTAGAPLRLVGEAWDPNTMSAVPGKDLKWQVDGKDVGGGAERMVRGIPPGSHSVTLSTVTLGGSRTSLPVKFVVRADADHDGVADATESKFPCVSPTAFDSLGDADSDGLSSLRESQYGTNPCKADSDIDGWSDGDEVELSSDPRSSKDQPDPARIYPDTEALDLGTCGAIEPGKIGVQTPSKTVPWSAAADVPYLNVSGGGPGPGVVTVGAKCAGLMKGQTFLGHVGIQAVGGQFREIVVRFRT